MINQNYIDMCSKATILQNVFMQDGKVPPNFIPSFVSYKDDIYILTHNVVGIILTDLVLINTSSKEFLPLNDNIIWLPTQEQMQMMYIDYVTKLKKMLDFNPLVMINRFTEWINSLLLKEKDNYDLILYLSACNINQLYMLFIMQEIFGMVWCAGESNWLTMESLGDMN